MYVHTRAAPIPYQLRLMYFETNIKRDFDRSLSLFTARDVYTHTQARVHMRVLYLARTYTSAPPRNARLAQEVFFDAFFVFFVAQYHTRLAFDRLSRSREKSAIRKVRVIKDHSTKHDGNDAAGSGTEDHQVLDVRFQPILRDYRNSAVINWLDHPWNVL